MDKYVGELDAQTMHESTMSPKTRNIIQVVTKDVKKLDKMIVNWMGSAVDSRKEMIENQLPSYIDLSE